MKGDEAIMSHSTCRFCEIGAALLSNRSTNLWDRVLLETDNFFVVPSLGSLIEGWLLIVTKSHHICMGSLDRAQIAELENLMEEVCTIVRSKYGPVAVFEHGPVEAKLAIGCGVDHAHIHVVPTSLPLIEEAGSLTDFKFHWEQIVGIKAVQIPYINGVSYLYVQQDGSYPMMYSGKNIPSQLFRKTIAASLGIPERYNWREYAFESNIVNTVTKLHPFAAKIANR